jgi:hypothetical protein
MNLSVLFIVVLLNSALCLIQFCCQEIDRRRGKIASRHSFIPGTNQKFLYWQDFYMQTYGDFLGLVWVMNGFAHLLVADKINFWMWILFGAIMITAAMLCLMSCLDKKHKPDWGYPSAGKVSLGGASHIPYFSLNCAMAVVCLIGIISGDLSGAVLWTTIAGGAFILLMAVADSAAGHFAPLQHKK